MGSVLDLPVAKDDLIELGCGKDDVAKVVRRLLGGLPIPEPGIESFRVTIDTDQRPKTIMPPFGALTVEQALIVPVPSILFPLFLDLELSPTLRNILFGPK